MSTAKSIKIPEIKTVYTPGVQLDLTLKEAQLLYDIGAVIGGDPYTTRRGLMDKIREAIGNCEGILHRVKAEDIKTLDYGHTGIKFIKEPK